MCVWIDIVTADEGGNHHQDGALLHQPGVAPRAGGAGRKANPWGPYQCHPRTGRGHDPGDWKGK